MLDVFFSLLGGMIVMNMRGGSPDEPLLNANGLCNGSSPDILEESWFTYKQLWGGPANEYAGRQLQPNGKLPQNL